MEDVAQEESNSEIEVDVEDNAFKAELSRLRGSDVEVMPETLSDKTDADDDAEPDQEEVIQPDSESKEHEESKDDLRQQIEKLQKALDRTNGTYGSQLASLQNQIKELTERGQKVTQESEQIEITEDDFEELKNEYPDVANMTAKGIARAIQKISQRNQSNNHDDSLRQEIAEQRRMLSESIREMKISALERDHPDYMDVAGYSEDKETGMLRWSNLAFGNWLATQPKETQEDVINGDNAYILSSHISAFKKTLEQSSSDVPVKRKVNIHKAIQPKGIPSSSSSGSLDPEDRGFIEEMKRLKNNR